MKKIGSVLFGLIVLFIVILFMVDQVYAQSSSVATASPVSNSTATNGVGNAQNISFSSPSESTTTIQGSTTIRNVPAMGTTLLTTSNDTCMGSTSGSVVVAGFGIGGGSTYVDTDCRRIKNARELWNMGMKKASLALMCNDPENRVALEVTGYACPPVKE